MNRTMRILSAFMGQMRGFGLLVGIAALVACAALAILDRPGAASGDIAGHGRSGSEPHWVAEIPLWRYAGLPRDSFAVLDEGIVRKTKWGLYAFRSKRTGDPCLALVDLLFAGVHHAFSVHSERSCRPSASLDRRPISVHSGYQYQERVGAPIVSADGLGFGFSDQVSHVSMDLQSGTHRTFAPRMMSSQQARKAGVMPFRYLAVGVASEVCIDRVEGFDDAGNQLFAYAPEQCREDVSYGDS